MQIMPEYCLSYLSWVCECVCDCDAWRALLTKHLFATPLPSPPPPITLQTSRYLYEGPEEVAWNLWEVLAYTLINI